MEHKIPEKYYKIFKYLESTSPNFETVLKDYLKLSKIGRSVFLKRSGTESDQRRDGKRRNKLLKPNHKQ